MPGLHSANLSGPGQYALNGSDASTTSEPVSKAEAPTSHSAYFETTPGVIPASYSAEANLNPDPCYVDPSLAANCCTPSVSDCFPGPGVIPNVLNVQEYIFDGGDTQPTMIVRQDYSVAGLEPTDTVAFYETLDGKQCITPSNRTAIYAPRFGSVRQVHGMQVASKSILTHRVDAPLHISSLNDQAPPSTVMQPLAPQGQERVSLIDAFQENRHGTPLESVVPPERVSRAIFAFSEINFFRSGQLDGLEVPVVGRVLANARTWTNPESLGVMINGQEALYVKDSARAEDFHVYDSPDGKCTLRLCKAASHTTANSGDIVSFSLRFDNQGAQPLGNLVLLDSLSPRLEYIEGSQQCSVNASFTTEPNSAGSLSLRWEIEAPLEPLSGGVISFDCRVR